MHTYRKANQEKWFSIISEFLGADKTQDQFCLEKELNKGTFLYWLKRYREENLDDRGGFVKIIEPAQSFCSNFTLKVGSVEIIPKQGASIMDIAKLVRLLSGND